MARIEPFDKYYQEYDNWFIENKELYQAELKAIKPFIPKNKKGLEIGVGSARFAKPLGVKVGVEPSKKIADIARNRGIKVYESIAEKLPFSDEEFDFALIVTTICFVDDILKTFQEAYRVIKNNGFIIVGFIDKDSYLGKKYQSKKSISKFYSYATFYSATEVLDYLKKAGFSNFSIKQTVFPEEKYNMSHIEKGFGEGSFIVIKGVKLNSSELDE